LPQGLLYTSLLLPVFLYWLYKRGRIVAMLKWGLLLLIPVPFHLFSGVELSSYGISTLLVFAQWVFLFTAIEAVRSTRDSLGDSFSVLLKINALLVLLALIILPFPALRPLMWDTLPMTRNLDAIPRLQLLAYEPSHYGLLLTPVFLFFIIKIITGKTAHPLLLAAAVGIPLLLTFSFGVTGAIALAVFIATAIIFRYLPASGKRLVLYSLFIFLSFMAAFWIFWPENPVFIRTENIFTGADSSTKGRLVHSFMFAKDLILQHNVLMGVGPGQIKILAHELIINFYQYSGEYAEIVRIPNSMGEMLATYGIYGFLLKIFFEIFFFVRLKIYRNLYSFTLFIFIFIYQFTGSFLVNAAEMGIWAIVFNTRIDIFMNERLKGEES
jgi:hypothetical protein